MIPGILKFFKGDRKYFTIVFLILILILLSAVITPLITGSIKSGWKDRIGDEVKKTEEAVNSAYREKEKILLQNANGIKSGLQAALSPEDASYGRIIELLNSPAYKDFAIEVYAPNGRLIGWNKNSPVNKGIPFPLKFPAGQAYFTNTELVTWLTVLDTINFDSDHFYIITLLPFQKHYSIQNPYFREIDFAKDISAELQTSVRIAYLPGEVNRDGRYSSFPLLNTRGSRIAEVIFQKPLLETEVNSVVETSSRIQGILLVMGYIILLYAFRNDFRGLKNRALKFLLVVVYLTGFRVLLFVLNIPSVFLNGDLNDPSYFSSTFAWGIVKSPVEFFLTNAYMLIIAVIFFNYARRFRKNREENKTWYYILLLPAAFFYLMLSRGLSASVRSIIFDSSIRYFKSSEIIPALPEMVMIFNLLLLGVVILLFILPVIYIPLSFIRTGERKFFRYTLLIFLIAGILFTVLQRQPLVSPLIQVIFIIVIFILYWIIRYGQSSAYNYVYISIAAAVITISLLNYFNQDLERESLKTTALELNRPNENLLSFLLRETLRTASAGEDINAVFNNKQTNYSASAFGLWSRSPLQRESLNSSLSLLDQNKKLLGEFRIGTGDETSPEGYFEHYTKGDIQIAEINRDNNTKLFKGITAVEDNGRIIGYISASVVFDMLNPAGSDYPDFLVSPKNFFNSVIDASQIKIFEIVDTKLTHVYGDIYPSRDQIKPIVTADFSVNNEHWQVLNINNERYISYSLKSFGEEGEKTTVVLYKEKQITWNLYNFFKIFVVHVLYIILLFVIIFILKIRKFRYTFRIQLVTAFLLISIIPLVILAVYNRQTVKQRSQQAISRELNERLDYIEKHVRSQFMVYRDRDFTDAFENAAAELGIAFNVYENTNLIFSSRDQYFRAGLFGTKLNPDAHYQLNYMSFREYLSAQQVENFYYNAFYKKLNIEGKDMIISVNDAFNKLQLSFSSADADILLFGVYSFAVIIIIIINTFLANRISAPISKLIRATNAVGQGDLSVQVENKSRGEMHDLINGFNRMTKELQKNESDLAMLERENAWKEMAKQVAHEIKNPLTPMKLAVQQLIISFKENKNFENIFDKISNTLLNQIENLNQIASEFSRFARMPNFKLEKVNLTGVIRDTVNLFMDEKIKLEFSPDTEEAYAEADNAQIRRLIINMIRNSIQSGADTISIILSRCEEGFEILIEDNGNGIKPEFQARIFEPDFTTKEKGMGLGLKLAKRFIEGIKGTISLVKSSEQGTQFRIYIPELK